MNEFFIPSDKVNPEELSPLTLAFMGDCVYEMLVREALVVQANRPSNELNRNKVRFVSASAQAEAYQLISEGLTEKELQIFKRGRNAHTTHTPKNMSSADYHAATGLEALFGYLYLNGEITRMRELFSEILKADESFAEKEKTE